jgi:Zn-dependent M16 (insulinase) family peptidase
MTRYIIGTIAGMDQPLTPAGRGDRAFRNYFSKRTAKEVQDDRDAVLATKAEDIRGFAKLVQDVLDQKAWCVYGNADRLKSEKQLFNQLVGLD